MTKDPIIAEIHAIRRQMWQESGGTPEKFAQYITRNQATYKDRLIDPAAFKQRKEADRKTTR